ncbi:MAG: hypothetical protein M3220_19040 [Chloroflexota bacterium]|nr:hypothetical protein [Chloroflexota bacterium]
MIEWKVLEEEPLPEGEIPQGDSERPRSRYWRLLLAGVLLVSAVVLGWRVREGEAQLRADVERAVLQEEQALRFGLVEQAGELADPAAPAGWLEQYRETFHDTPEEVPEPEVTSVEHVQDIALATLSYETREATWQSVRAYRLVDGAWHRTPISKQWWGQAMPHHSEHFTLWMGERDGRLLPPADFLAELERFYGTYAALWPVATTHSITVRIEPEEWHNEATVSRSSVTVNSPWLAPYDPTAPLSSLRSYQLDLVDRIAASADEIIPRGGATQQYLRPALREALVRYLFLDAGEREQYRDFVRAQATEGPVRADLTSFPYRVFFADFMIEEAGAAAPGRFITAYESSGDLEMAATATGLPYDFLKEGALQWLETGQRPYRSAWSARYQRRNDLWQRMDMS